MGKTSRKIQLIVAILLILSSVVILFWEYVTLVIFPRPDYERPEEDAFAQATPTATVPVATPVPTASAAAPEPTATPQPIMQEKWAELHDANSDFVGWLSIEDTNIDYPIVQGEDDEFYLKHNYDKERDSQGWIFLGTTGNVLDNDKNLVLWGHNQRNGRMFGHLQYYDTTRHDAALQYYQEHPVVEFDTLYQDGLYKIFAVMIVDVTEEPMFYFPYNSFASDEVFLNFVEQIQRRSLITTSVDVEKDDKLLMLTTCLSDWQLGRENGESRGRLVVVCRRVRDGEDAQVDTQSAAVNQNVLMPARWYEMHGGTAPVFE